MRSNRLPAPPEASPEALANSQRLRGLIAERIAEAGGWLSFADYMALALYAPGLGYYTAGAHKFGAAGDFVTAPELTPLFGQALAAQVADVLRASSPHVLELGAGSGRLAVDLMRALARIDCLPERYSILEVSPDLRERQSALLHAEVPELSNRVDWLDALPESFSGLILGNEVLDALPVYALAWRPDGPCELGVALDDPRTGFIWQERPLVSPALRQAVAGLPSQEEGYRSEVCLAAPALVHSLAERLVNGALLFIDYGHARNEYYHPERRSGTLMCHYRHRAYDDPFYLPGLADITAHVDFTAIADAALAAGMHVPGYASQANFLINCGILDRLGENEPASLDYFRRTAEVQKLLDPSGMGESFQVMLLAKDLDMPWRGFMRGDRRHTL
jgi:SAM-dependent MidA family methyltransferase